MIAGRGRAIGKEVTIRGQEDVRVPGTAGAPCFIPYHSRMNRFRTLASGSAGNAALVETAAGRVLVDCGLSQRVLGYRLASVGSKWEHVTAAILTHTHADHWHATTLVELRRRKIPLFLHERHADHLRQFDAFLDLESAGLTRPYSPLKAFSPLPGVDVRAAAVPHDSDPTFALRFDIGSDSLGYAADVGEPTRELATLLHGVGVLALEFNHCEAMQRASRRPVFLVRRVLGPYGHLSNAQAAVLCRALAGFGALVQLHLSRECNTPELARSAATVACPGVELITAGQNDAGPAVRLRPGSKGQPDFSAFASRGFQPRLTEAD
jgi:phosphoribosyl 1,2-cyclic phosphodiesterase